MGDPKSTLVAHNWLVSSIAQLLLQRGVDAPTPPSSSAEIIGHSPQRDAYVLLSQATHCQSHQDGCSACSVQSVPSMQQLVQQEQTARDERPESTSPSEQSLEITSKSGKATVPRQNTGSRLPEIKVSSSLSCFNPLKLLSSDGIDPRMLVPRRSISVSLVSCPSSLGIVPLSPLFPCSWRLSNPSQFPKPGNIIPENLDRSR
mmetsp:Transcript_23070/g.65392  ORF Transcript_23070/g.65392 Transcript_23070/m.65392 type:complete len:203 (+) Transcript_23070:189-797(+)